MCPQDCGHCCGDSRVSIHLQQIWQMEKLLEIQAASPTAANKPASSTSFFSREVVDFEEVIG